MTETEYKIISASPTQYSITTQIENINICITNYSDDETMMICVTDCGLFAQWILATKTSTEVRFGKTNTIDPFGSSMARLLIGHLRGVEQLLLGVGIKNTSREKMLMIVEHIKVTMAKALIEITEKMREQQRQALF